MLTMERALVGAVVAALVTAYARRVGALDESGQWAAFGCGILASVAGWPWAALLIAYFVAASAVSHLGAARKAERTQASTPQVPTRDAYQVLANGGVFTLLALRAGAAGDTLMGVAAAGALAAASADTWATEFGTLWGGAPRSIVSGRTIAPGMSGGVTVTGTVAALVGAAVVALLDALVHGLPPAGAATRAVFLGGVAGAFADSLLGATVQAKRWCEHCAAWTERRVHPCGYRTVHAAGFRWMTNDAVNAGATLAGAAVAAGAARWWR